MTKKHSEGRKDGIKVFADGTGARPDLIYLLNGLKDDPDLSKGLSSFAYIVTPTTLEQTDRLRRTLIHSSIEIVPNTKPDALRIEDGEIVPDDRPQSFRITGLDALHLQRQGVSIPGARALAKASMPSTARQLREDLIALSLGERHGILPEHVLDKGVSDRFLLAADPVEAKAITDYLHDAYGLPLVSAKAAQVARRWDNTVVIPIPDEVSVDIVQRHRQSQKRIAPHGIDYLIRPFT